MPDASGGGAMGAPPAKGQEWLASTSVGGASGGGASTGGASGGLAGGGAATGGGTDINSLIQQLQTAVAALQSALEGAGLLGPGGTPITGGGGSAPASGCGCGAGMVQQSPEQVGGAAGGVEAARADKPKKPKKQGGGNGSGDAAAAQAAQGASGPGAAPSGFKITNPLQGARVSSDFGPRASGNHTGYDLAKAQGSTIVAAAPGKVVRNVSLKDSYGNYIDIDHGNGWVTRYAHMVSKSPIPVGTTVNAGQPIGKVGSTGNSTGPHLHFEVIKNGAKLDPEPFLKGTKTF